MVGNLQADHGTPEPGVLQDLTRETLALVLSVRWPRALIHDLPTGTDRPLAQKDLNGYDLVMTIEQRQLLPLAS